MTAAKEYDSVRTMVETKSIFDDRNLPAGLEGMVLKAKPDGTCLVELAVKPQTTDHGGDFAQVVLTEGHCEITHTAEAPRTRLWITAT